ncbi:SCO family protein [Polynucleobacter bastaniensis]|jgi:protein SCO1/2|uniref:SCO family protein n=1 Tax=Polynucleobacter bastaniensis TaxID=2081039 RepID=UPI001C0DD2B2|nr:SCO family protein [Polynucleobacter bastaniensis]MBU3597879.1 SCO family protein [Polynucleobacter bastaniensis]
MQWHRPASLALAGALLLGVASLGYAQTAQSRAESVRLMNDLMSGKGRVGGPFTLLDQNGKKRTLAEFKGKVVLIYFGYMFCPDICPTDLSNLAGLLKRLGKDSAQVQVIFITLDPARDTQEFIGKYVEYFDKRILGLRGTEQQTKQVATQYKTFYEKVGLKDGQYVIDHTAFTYIMNRNGKYLAFFPPGTSPERMEVMVREALATSEG